jgi:hypothetical protein
VGDEPQYLEEDQHQHNYTVRVKRVEILSWQLSRLMPEAQVTPLKDSFAQWRIILLTSEPYPET